MRLQIAKQNCIYTNIGITNFILKFADDTKVFGKVMDEKDKGMLQTDLIS